MSIKILLLSLIAIPVTFFSPSALAVPSNSADLSRSLFYAARGGYIDAARNLVEQGANVNYTNASNETPMHAAAATGKLGMIQFLMSKNAKLQPRTRQNWIPLHHAVRFGHVHVANYLLAHGSPLYLRTSSGQSVFDLAKVMNNQRMIHLLDSYRGRVQRVQAQTRGRNAAQNRNHAQARVVTRPQKVNQAKRNANQLSGGQLAAALQLIKR
jgi:hypothetical protein